MQRPAAPADLGRLLAIRDASGVDALSDPALIDDDELARLIVIDAVAVWEEDGRVMGFSAAAEGGAIHLLVDTACRGKGVGRALLEAACTMLKEAGCAVAALSATICGSAIHHYRAAGWNDTGASRTGGIVLKKPL